MVSLPLNALSGITVGGQRGVRSLFHPSWYDDPEYWRKGAQTMRDLAAQIDDEKLKKQALQVAHEFDRHGNKVEERQSKLLEPIATVSRLSSNIGS